MSVLQRIFSSGPGEPLCWQIPKISTLAGAAAAEDGGGTAAKAAIVVAAYAAIVAKRCGYTWQEMEAAVGRRIGKSVPVITILLAIGFMLGGLMFSGTLPMLIYYGLQIVSPRWIALCAFLLCCIFSTVTGTSNGSASTAGLAMMGLAMAMDNVNLGLVAGACYAGSQFGDKLSPLSDTTVLAALTTDNDIFDHIAHMAKTVVPSPYTAIR